MIRSILRSTPPPAAAQNDPGGSGGSGNFYEPLRVYGEKEPASADTAATPTDDAPSTSPPKLQVLEGGKKGLTSWMGAIVGLTKKLPKARGDYQTDMDKSKGILCDKKAE